MEFEVGGIFLDISKALVKVWNDGLIFKLHQNGICGERIRTLPKRQKAKIRCKLSMLDLP